MDDERGPPGSDPADFVVDRVATEELRARIEGTLDALLTVRERVVLEQRFGLLDGRSRTLAEVASYFGVSKERIRQIEARALEKLRNPPSARLKDFLE